MNKISIEHLSPSTANSYRTCARQVYFKKIMGLPDNTNYVATAFGSACHRVNEIAMKEKQKGIKISLDDMYDIFKETFIPLSEKVTVWKDEDLQHMLDQGVLACEDFYCNWLDAYEPLYIEKKFNISRGEGKLPIVTVADLITKDKVIDYKYGRSSRKENYLLNMSTYAYCFWKEFGKIPKVYFLMAKWNKRKTPQGYRYFFQKHEEVQLPVTKKWFSVFNNIYDEVERGINAGIWLPALDGTGLCKNCSYHLSGDCDVIILDK